MQPSDAPPEFARIKDAMRLFGISRTRLYAEAAAGRIRMKKLGVNATVVDLASLRAFMASLPDAELRTPPATP